jgi:hypothetical protein
MRNSDSFGRPADFTEDVAVSIVIKKGRVCLVLPALVPIVSTTTGPGRFLKLPARLALEEALAEQPSFLNLTAVPLIS